MISELVQYRKKVFLCHQKEDVEFVKKVAERLKYNKISPWVDYANLLPGENWEQRIIKEIKSTDAVLVFLSELASTKEGFFHEEIYFAMKRIRQLPPKRRLFIFPLKIDARAEIYDPLAEYQHIDAFEPYGDWFEKLLQSLGIQSVDEIGYSLERQQTIIKIEQYKIDLVKIWIQRDQNESSSKRYQELEDKAYSVVHKLNKLCESIGDSFNPSLLYRKAKFSFEIENNVEVENEELIFYPPHGVLVPEKYIGKKLFIVNHGESPRRSSSSKKVGQILFENEIYGYAHFYSYTTERGVIEENKKYDIYDGWNNESSKFIGSFESIVK